jgi:hypothetical protein
MSAGASNDLASPLIVSVVAIASSCVRTIAEPEIYCCAICRGARGIFRKAGLRRAIFKICCRFERLR